MADQALPQYSIRDFSAGMITSINESIRPRNSVALGLNFDFDTELGSAVTRLGTFIVGGQMVDGKTVKGLHQHRGSTNKLLAAINDTDDLTGVIFDAGTGAVEQTGLTPSKKTRFLTYLGETLVLNGADAERAWNEAAWITTGGAFDLANIPGANKCNLVAEFLDRVYLAGDTTQPSRLYYSTVPSAGAVTWTPDYVDVEAEDGGGEITALSKVPGYILVFKQRTLHRWNFVSAFPESLVNIGTPSQESVVSHAGICAFFSASSRDSVGFYVTNGGRPVPISHLKTKNIQKWVRAINPSNYNDIVGWGDETHFCWSIGNVTVDAQVYKNVVVRWSVHTGEWTVRSYPNRATVGANYLTADNEVVSIVGTNDGEVVELDKTDVFTDYVTISGEPGFTNIMYDIRTYQEKFKFNQIKEVKDKLVINTRNGKGAVPYVIPDGKEILELAAVQSDISDPSLPENLKGNYFEFGLRGSVQGAQLVVKEIEVPTVSIDKNFT